MVARSSPWVAVSFGAGCLAAGIALGAAWPHTSGAPLLPAAPPAQPFAGLPSFAPVVAKVAAAVVSVRARGRIVPLTASPAPGDTELMAMQDGRSRERTGSGFLVQQNGLVVTGRHVVVDAEDVEVWVAERGRFRGELVGEDRATDVALLRLVDAPANLPTLPLATDAALRSGDWIVAVGNPFGFAQSVTAGIVSFVGRHLPHSDYAVTTDFLQISAPVNPGNSGCPVLDLDGRVVGLMTQAPIEAQGISFAVPSKTVAWAVETMLRVPDGRVRRGYLGIEFATIGRVVDGRGGAVIVQVLEGQAAHRAGVRVGDVVLEVDGAPVVDAQSLHERIVCSAPGTSMALQVLRDGALKDPIVAVLGEVGSRSLGLPN